MSAGRGQENRVKIPVKEPLALLFIFLIIFGLRLNYSTQAVIDRDESVYFVVAQDLASGGLLYGSSWDHKGPLLYFIFLPVIKAFGNNIFALRIFTTLYLLLCVFFVYLISSLMFGESNGLAPPLIYGLFFSSPGLGGLASNAELFMMLPAIIAAYCFLSYIKDEKGRFLKLSICGFFSAAAVLIKATAFFTVVLLPVILTWRLVKRGRGKPVLCLKEISSYLFGCAAIAVVILYYFISRKTLAEFYNSYFIFNSQYVKMVPFGQWLENLALLVSYFLQNSVFALLALISLLIVLIKKERIADRRFAVYFVISLSAFSFMGVASCRNAFPHYLLQMGLPLSLLAGLAISLLGPAPCCLSRFICVGIALLLSVAYWPPRIKSFLGGYKNQKDQVEYRVAGYISSHTAGGDSIFVLRGEPVIYFLSQRRAPVKYFFWLSHYYYDEILKIRDYAEPLFLKNKPAYITDRQINNDEYPQVSYVKKFMVDNYYIAERIGDYILYKRRL